MISRRKARIKALQTLFMGAVYDADASLENPEKLKEFYKDSIQQVVDEVYTVLWFMREVSLESQDVYEAQTQKLSVDQNADARILRLAQIPFVEMLEADPSFRKKTEKLHLSTEVDSDLIRSLYRQYIALDEVQDYLDLTEHTESADQHVLSILLQDVLLPSEPFQDFMESKYSLWYDDETEVVHIISRIIDMGLAQVSLEQLASKDVYDLGLQLIDAVVSQRDYFDSLIRPKLKNWDPKRVAPLDIIVLYMGIAEFLYMPTVPVVVTINEYIDIIKQYGASQSKQFVNAILDRVKNQLETEQLLNKE